MRGYCTAPRLRFTASNSESLSARFPLHLALVAQRARGKYPPIPSRKTTQTHNYCALYRQDEELSSTQSARHVSPEEFHRILWTEAARQSHRERASSPKAEPVESCECSKTSTATICRDKARDGAGSPIETTCTDDRQPEPEEKRPTPGSSTAVAEHHEHFTEERTTVLLDVRNVYETSIGHFRYTVSP